MDGNLCPRLPIKGTFSTELPQGLVPDATQSVLDLWLKLGNHNTKVILTMKPNGALKNDR